MYSIYASFRHPDTGREVATIELTIAESIMETAQERALECESIAEIYSRAIDNKSVSIVEYMKGYFLANNDYMPLVVVMKRGI